MKSSGESAMNDRDVRYCCICGKRFEPHPRVGGQRTCGDDDCQKQRRCSNSRTWRARYPQADDALSRQSRQADRRAYRRQHWATHPEARQYHAAYMRQWRARHKIPAVSQREGTYRDIEVNFPAVNSYLQVIDVREANRVITVKLLSEQDMIRLTPA